MGRIGLGRIGVGRIGLGSSVRDRVRFGVVLGFGLVWGWIGDWIRLVGLGLDWGWIGNLRNYLLLLLLLPRPCP